MKIVKAKLRHMEMVADIFCLAFGDSISFFAEANSKIKLAFIDVFTMLHRAFGDGFMVALDEDEVCGYIVMADDIKRLWMETIFSGFLFKIAARAIGGVYGLKVSTLYKIVKNKLLYMKFEVTTPAAAQILSVAVHPKHQGRGIGRSLVGAGIAYIDDLGINRIKLEVRPGNTAAIKAYQKYGFNQKGIARDLQGEWLVMVRKGE